MKKEEKPELTRVLFELSIDEEGGVCWKTDPTLPPVMLLSVLGGLRVAQAELTAVIAGVDEDE